jgi:hypothetical protein
MTIWVNSMTRMPERGSGLLSGKNFVMFNAS